MAGTCPRDITKLKGGVACVDSKGHTCFCSKVGCRCGIYYEGSQANKNFDAQVEWCTQYDPHGKYNKFCKDHDQNLPEPVVVMGTNQAKDAILSAANSVGFNWDNLTTFALIGIGVLAVFMMVS